MSNDPLMINPEVANLNAQVFLVGDPIQLPATVLSNRALSHGYDTSLFKRLQAAGTLFNILISETD